MQYPLPNKILFTRHVHTNAPVYLQTFAVKILLSTVLTATVFNLAAQTTQTFTGSGSFSPAAGVPTLNVECWAGGGGGGNAAHTGTGTSRGGGGAGGAYSKKIFSSPMGTYTITVGAGGTGGNPGSDSWFGCTCSLIAKGGAAGGNGNKSDGAGGAGTASGSVGDAGSVFAGGSGVAASVLGTGAGGGGAGSTGTGKNASLTIVNGGATASNGGAGAAGFLLGLGVANGNNGNNYGGGGSGATCITLITGSSATGGTGGAGMVTVTYTCPVYALTGAANSQTCAGNTATVTISGLAADLPAGTYTVTYDLSGTNTAAGATASMTVTTAGTGSFTTAALSNSGATSITITNLRSGSGVGCSSNISSNNTATITVNTAPGITLQPSTPAATCSGSGIQAISVTATGSGLSYSWRKNSAPVSNGSVYSGQGTATLTLTNATAVEAGSYDVVVSGSCNPSLTSNSVIVTVNALSAISAGAVPSSQTKLLNAVSSGLSVAASGTAINYQWYSNTSNSNSGGVSLGAADGGQTNTYTPSTAVAGTVYYYCTVSGTCGTASSSTAVVIATNTDIWQGGGTTNWSTGTNWNTGTAPGGSNDVLIPTGNTPYPELTAASAAASIELQSGTSVGIGSNTFTINGAVSGTGSITGSVSASLVINAAAGNLYFTNSGTGNYLKSFTVGNGASASLGNVLNISAGSSMNNEGTLTVTGTGILITNDSLIIQSNEFGTARIAAGNIAGGYISGDVTIERYIPQNNNKGWRMLASNTNGQTIKEAWQENQPALANGHPGYGLMITKNFPTLTDAQAAGFDTLSPMPSLYKFSTASNGWVAMTNTDTSLFTAEEGYFVFVRGDRRPGQFIAYSAPVGATTLRSKGLIFQGNQPVKNIPAGKYSLLRNPYASAIDLRNISIGGGLVDAVQVWDPKLNGTTGNGAYQTLTRSGANYLVTPGGGSFPASGGIWNTVESGDAFVVQATGIAGTLQVLENSKTAGSKDVFRPQSFDGKRIMANLYNAANHSLLDGNMILFDTTAGNAVDRNDVKKLSNTGENFGLLTAGTELVVERRDIPTVSDTIQFNLSNLKRIDYDLELIVDNLDLPGMYAYVEDQYNSNIVLLNSSGTTALHFTVNTDPTSYTAGRFRLLFKPLSVLPLSFVTVRAEFSSKHISVDWKVANQYGGGNYIVERSSAGNVFNPVGSMVAGNSCSYHWQEENVLTGTYYYRIRYVALDGHSLYSESVKINAGNSNSEISISPNPVTGHRLHITVPVLAPGDYQLVFSNSTGGLEFLTHLKHSGGKLQQPVELPANLPNGIYQLRIILNGELVLVSKMLINRRR